MLALLVLLDTIGGLVAVPATVEVLRPGFLVARADTARAPVAAEASAALPTTAD